MRDRDLDAGDPLVRQGKDQLLLLAGVGKAGIEQEGVQDRRAADSDGAAVVVGIVKDLELSRS